MMMMMSRSFFPLLALDRVFRCKTQAVLVHIEALGLVPSGINRMRRRSKPNSMSGIGAKGTDDRHHQTHQQGHRLLNGAGEVRIEASGDRSRQERECQKSDHGNSGVQKISKPPLVFLVRLVQKKPGTRNLRILEIGSPQTSPGYKSVVQSAVVGFVAIRVAGEETQGAEDDERRTGHHLLGLVAVAVVGG